MHLPRCGTAGRSRRGNVVVRGAELGLVESCLGEQVVLATVDACAGRRPGGCSGSGPAAACPAACASAIWICLRMKSRSERTSLTPGPPLSATSPAVDGVTSGGAGMATTGVVGAENTCSVTPCASV